VKLACLLLIVKLSFVKRRNFLGGSLALLSLRKDAEEKAVLGTLFSTPFYIGSYSGFKI